MNPLTPDHHFYIDQGTNARVRLVLLAIGRKLVAEGRLDDPEDVMYLKYNEMRALMAGSNRFDAEELVGDRRDAREDAYEVRPRDWVGTATEGTVGVPVPGRCGPSRRSSTASAPDDARARSTAWPPRPASSRAPPASCCPPSSSARWSATRSWSAG